MKRHLKKIIPVALICALFITVLVAGCVTPATDNALQKDVTQKAAEEINSRINSIYADLKISTENISKSSLNGTLDPVVATQELANIYQRNDLACQIVAVDKNGLVISTYPKNNVIENKERLPSKEYLQLLSSVPNGILISNLFESEMGFKRIGSSMMVKKDGEYLGSVDVGFDPYDLFGDVQKIVSEYGLNLVVIQDDGTQIYDPDVGELGSNILTEDRFKDVLETMKNVISKNEGVEMYKYYEDLSTNKVEKTISWTTMSGNLPYMLLTQNWTIATTASPGMPKAIDNATSVKPKPEINNNLTRVEVAKLASDEVLSSLWQATTDLNVAADKIASSYQNKTFDERISRQALATLYQENALSCQIVAEDKDGKVIAAYPESNTIPTTDEARDDLPDELKSMSVFENVDVAVTSLFKAPPYGYYAIASTVPIKKDGEIIGRINMAYDPYDLFGDVQQTVSMYNMDLLVEDTNGYCLYEPEVRLIGTNAIEIGEFDSIDSVIKTVLSKDEGELSYEFMSRRDNVMVTMIDAWTTLNYGGQCWKIVAIEGDPLY